MSMRKGSGRDRIKSFSDLGEYRDEFDSNIEEGASLNISSEIRASESKFEEIKVKGYSNLKSAKSRDRLFRINTHPKVKSDISPENQFSNLLERIDSGELCNNIRNIYAACGKECAESEIPFKLEEEKLDIHGRHRRILNKFDISVDEDEVIHKATYATKFMRDISSNTKRNNPVRIFFKRKGVNIEIILIDLYHLFATEKLDKFKEVSGYKICMTKLKNWNSF